MKWILKAIVQKTISFLPNGSQVNYWFQKNITKGVVLNDTYFDDKLIHVKHHLEYWQTYGKDTTAPRIVLELGTGWYPIIPVCLFLAGADQIVTVDIRAWMKQENIAVMLEKFVAYYKAGKLQNYLEIQPERWRVLEEALMKVEDLSRDELLQKLQVHYLICDARKLPFEDETFDFITSNNTFEHVYPTILEGILLEFKRLLKKDGLMSHFIDMSDHFAHMDASINIYHFLRYSQRQWDWIDNSIQPQNRWRITHFRELYKRLSLPIIYEDNRDGDLPALQSLKIHPEFLYISEKELAISHSYIVSSK